MTKRARARGHLLSWLSRSVIVSHFCRGLVVSETGHSGEGKAETGAECDYGSSTGTTAAKRLVVSFRAAALR